MILQHGLLLLSRFSRVRLFGTPWTVAHQIHLSMGFSRQEYWSGLPCPPPGDLPDPGIELTSCASPTLQMCSLPTEPPWKPTLRICFPKQPLKGQILTPCSLESG